MPGDVASSESVAELGAAVASFGGADIFIHNAGIYPMETPAERDVRVMPARHGRQPRFDDPALQASEVGDNGVTVNALSPEVGGHREMGVFELLANAHGIKPNGMPADLAGARVRGATMPQPFVFICRHCRLG